MYKCFVPSFISLSWNLDDFVLFTCLSPGFHPSREERRVFSLPGCSMSSIICLCLSSELFLNSTIKILQKDFGRFFLVDSLSFRNWDQITWFSAGVREELLRNMQQVLVALSACKESNNFIST